MAHARHAGVMHCRATPGSSTPPVAAALLDTNVEWLTLASFKFNISSAPLFRYFVELINDGAAVVKKENPKAERVIAYVFRKTKVDDDANANADAEEKRNETRKLLEQMTEEDLNNYLEHDTPFKF